MNLRRYRTIAGIIALLMIAAVGVYALYSDLPLVSVDNRRCSHPRHPRDQGDLEGTQGTRCSRYSQ